LGRLVVLHQTPHHQILKAIVSFSALTTGAFVFAGLPGRLERVFLEVRTLLPALVSLVSTFVGVSAGPGGLPALVWHVLVLPHAILCVLRCGGIVGDEDASLGKIGQLVSLVSLRLSATVGTLVPESAV
jgi:hypothetical protein